MKITQLLLQSILILLSSPVAIAQNEYYKVYGTPNDDYPVRLDHCSDGGYYHLARTNSALYREDAVLTRTNASGVVMWSKTIRFDTSGVSLTGGGMLNDESYILLFHEYNPIYQSMTIVMKLDPSGDSLWTKMIFSMNLCCTQDPIIPLSNGDFLLGGRHQYFMGESYYGCIQRIDSSGNSVFRLTFGQGDPEVALGDFEISPDSEIVSVGSMFEHISTHPAYAFLVKHDMNGNFISSEIYKDTVNLSFNNIVTNPDHTYTISEEQFILKTDTSGVILSAFKNIGTDPFYNIKAAPDSGYLVRAGSHGFGQLTTTFDTIWTRTFPSVNAGGFYFNPVDKSITLSAVTDSITNLFGNDDVVLIHVDSAENSTCLITGYADVHFQPVVNTIIGFDSIYMPGGLGPEQINYSQHQITFQSGILSDTVCSPLGLTDPLKSAAIIFPNPVYGKNFHLQMENSMKAEILMMGIDGKIISGLRKEKTDATGITFSIPPTLANGIYFLKIVSNDETAVLKLVVAR